MDCFRSRGEMEGMGWGGMGWAVLGVETGWTGWGGVGWDGLRKDAGQSMG